MFRLYKLKSDKSRLRIDFNLSGLQASQVPKGWDKLFVSAISVETGKIISKSGKATPKNGRCRWTETLSESLCVIVGETKQAADQCLVKLVIATGPSKSSILGEVTVNLVDHINLETSTTLSLPLQKCIYGTMLHVNIHCISPRTSQRIENPIDEMSNTGDRNNDCDDMEIKSDISDTCFTKSVASSSSTCFESPSHMEDVQSRDIAVAMSGSRNSFESHDDSLGRSNSSPCSNISGHTDESLCRQDSTDSQSPSPYTIHSISDPPRPHYLLMNSRVPRSRGQSLGQADDFSQLSISASSYVLHTGSSNDLLEVVDGSKEDFRVQAKKWERNARRLSAELDRLRKRFDEQSKNQELLDSDLASSKAQCEGLRQENEQLKNVLEETKHKSMETSNSHSKNFQKQLEDELRFYKESNAKLGMQLEKTQESNVELVSILQELEETIEKQKEEINSKHDEVAVYKNTCENNRHIEQDSPENTTGNQNSGKNSDIREKPELETLEKLLSTIHDLERTLQECNSELESEKNLNTQTLLDCERKWRSKLVAKEEEVINLEEKLSMLAQPSNGKKVESADPCYQVDEIQALKDKVQELENDCNELTDENLDLLVKLKRAESSLQKSSTYSNSFSVFDESEARDHNQLDKESEARNREIFVMQNGCLSEGKCQSLQDKCKDLESQLRAATDKISYLEDELRQIRRTKEDTHGDDLASTHEKKFPLIESHSSSSEDSRSGGASVDDSSGYPNEELLTTSSLDESLGKVKDSQFPCRTVEPSVLAISDVAEDKRVLEDCKDTKIKNKNVLTRESMDNLDFQSLNGSVGSHDSVSEVLHQLSVELETGNLDLEFQICELEKENVQLSERISGLEAQLRYLTDEKESSRLELQQSGSRVSLLQEEIRKLLMEMETQRTDMDQKFLDMQQRWSEAQEECEYLKIVHPKLQDTAERIIEECSLLQRTNRDLRRQNVELSDHCAHLKAGHRETENTYSLSIQKIETLETDFSSLVEEISLKAESFKSEVDALLLETEQLKGQLLTEESQFFQDYLEKQAEVENLQSEIQYLSEQLLKAHNGEQTSSEAALEMSKLYANNAKLEAAQLETQEMLKMFKHKYDILKVEFEAKEAEFSHRLADSNKKYEVLLADHERLQMLHREAKSSEQKARSTIYALDLKLGASEHDRLQLEDEVASLKHQLLKLLELQNEVSALKSSLNEAKFANGRLEASFQLIYQDHEELKADRNTLVQKILSMQMLESELEDCRNSKVALQEKLLRLEGDLTAREAECAEDVKIKHELGRMRRTNSQLQRKIRDFDIDNDEVLKTFLGVEGNQKQKILRHVASDLGRRFGRARPRYSTNDITISEDSEFSEMNNGQHSTTEKALVVEIHSESPDVSHRPSTLICDAQAYKESKEDEYKKKAAELEAELKDLHNRYFNMSLRYAEIENEREELSIKLNAVEEGRRWFSYKP